MKKILLAVFAVLFTGQAVAVELKINVAAVPALVGPSGITDVTNCSGTSLNPALGSTVTTDITGLDCVEVVTASPFNDYEYDTYDMSSQCNIFSNSTSVATNGFTIWGGPNLTSQENFGEDCLLTFNGASGPPPSDSGGGGGSDSGGGGSAAMPVPALPLLGLLSLGGLLGFLGLRKLRQ
ncbi:MAG: hypothetical protein ACPH3A_10155 [Luminiphilus sp.]